MKTLKKSRSAPSAEKPTQNEPPTTPTTAPAPASTESVPPKTVDSAEILNQFVQGISEDKIQLAEAAGIPVRPLLGWAVAVTAELQEIKKTLPDTIKAKMGEAIQEAQQRAMAERQALAQTPQAEGGGGTISTILELLKTSGIAGGGGGMDEEMSKMLKEMMNLNILRMKQDMNFTDAIKNAIVSKITGKALGEMTS